MFKSDSELTLDNDPDNVAVGDTYKAPKILWKYMPVGELLRVRDEIERHLPPLTLAEIDLEKELLLQYHAMRALYNDIVTEDGVPANQKAQVGNSVTASLDKLSSLQLEMHSAEQFKKIENMMIRMLNKLPEDVAAEFLAEYRKAHERG